MQFGCSQRNIVVNWLLWDAAVCAVCVPFYYASQFANVFQCIKHNNNDNLHLLQMTLIPSDALRRMDWRLRSASAESGNGIRSNWIHVHFGTHSLLSTSFGAPTLHLWIVETAMERWRTHMRVNKINYYYCLPVRCVHFDQSVYLWWKQQLPFRPQRAGTSFRTLKSISIAWFLRQKSFSIMNPGLELIAGMTSQTENVYRKKRN